MSRTTIPRRSTTSANVCHSGSAIDVRSKSTNVRHATSFCANSPTDCVSCDSCANPRCICATGWRTNWDDVDGRGAPQCAEDIDECLSENKICKHNSPCVNLPGSYHCNCTRGWVGDNCDIAAPCCPQGLSHCGDSDVNCSSHATCIGTGTCQCDLDTEHGNAFVSCNFDRSYESKIYISTSNSLEFSQFDDRSKQLSISLCPITIARPALDIPHVPDFRVLAVRSADASGLASAHFTLIGNNFTFDTDSSASDIF